MSEPLTTEDLLESPAHAQLPPGLRLLYILGPHSPRDWLTQALHEAAVDQIHVTVTPSFTAALERLREQACDVVLLDQDASHRPAAHLITAIQAGTRPDQAVVVLGEGNDRVRAADFLLAGASAYLSLRSTTTQELVCQLERAAQLSRVQAENYRLRSWQQRHDERDQGEALGYLQEQGGVVSQFAASSAEFGEDDRNLTLAGSPDVRSLCRDLLQAYVVMGGGGLNDEVRRLVVRWQSEARPLGTLLLEFNGALQSLIQDRGGRSARHVLHRGNLLLLELLLSWTQREGGAR